MIDTLAGALEHQSSWTEGCRCHEQILTSSKTWTNRTRAISKELKRRAADSDEVAGVALSAVLSCRLRGRRSSEFASGVFDEFVADIVSVAHSQLAVALVSLDPEDRALLTADWTNATASRP